VIQWMLNNAWPSLIWHLYDYYLQPAGGYFGAKKACEPLHVQYSYDDRSVDIVNSRYEGVSGLLATAEVYDIGLRQTFSRQARIDVGPDAVSKVLTLPEEAFDRAEPLHFVRLRLENSSGETISTNFYWISSKKTVYDWNETTYRYTPVSSYEDFSALQTLPKAGTIGVSTSLTKGSEGAEALVRLQNSSDKLAFQIHLGISREGEEAEILPVLWQDNYIELMPGESREVTAKFLSPDALNGGAELRVTGWNIQTATAPLNASPRGSAAGGSH